MSLKEQPLLRALYKRRETVVYGIFVPPEESADETLQRLGDGEGEVVRDWAKQHPLLVKYEDPAPGDFKLYRVDKV